jgi:hypothetical protein
MSVQKDSQSNANKKGKI